MTGLLSGLRVVDCTRGTAGPRATGLLADQGADVIWVEPVGGDPYRRSLATEYAVFNRGKRSITLDLKGTGRETLWHLLATADVFVESWRPGVADRLGLGYVPVHERLPGLVYCSISGFGRDGPYRDVPGYEPLVHAIVGTMGEQFGHRDGPIFEALPFASIGAASLAAIGVLASLFRRSSDGIGRRVETSLLDGALAFLSMLWGEAAGETKSRDPNTDSAQLNASGDSTRLICQSFLCADDEYIGVHTGAVGAFGRLMKVLGLDDRIRPSESGMDMGVPLTEDERQVLHSEIHGIFSKLPRDEWVQLLLDADVCGVPQLRPGEVFDEPQAEHNRMVLGLRDPVLDLIEQVASPVRFSAGSTSQPAPAPVPGEHTDIVMAEIADAKDRKPPWFGAGALDDRPLLDGVVVLDLGAFFAGPYASRLLGDLGADVIKLETVAGDPLRGLPGLFRAAQVGKRSVSMDLKHPEAQAVLRSLLERVDVVHHNMRPGAAERLGVGYRDVQLIRQDVIYGYAPGWGPDGPFARRQSFEPMISGYVGIGFEVAGEFNPPLYPAGNADPGNGLTGAFATLVALLHRERTGAGQSFENPQLNTAMTHLAHVVRRPDGTVLGAGRLDPLQRGQSALERLYETADGWLCLVAHTDAHVSALGDVLETNILSDPRFHDAAMREIHDYELGELLADALATKSTDHWLEALSSAGIAVAVPRPYNNLAFMRDRENVRSGRVIEFASDRGPIRQIGRLLRVSHARVGAPQQAPALGEHTDTILQSLAVDEERIELLRSQGAIR